MEIRLLFIKNHENCILQKCENRVVKEIPDLEGKAEAWFYEPGGGIQYMFEESIQYYIDNGYLEVV